MNSFYKKKIKKKKSSSERGMEKNIFAHVSAEFFLDKFCYAIL